MGLGFDLMDYLWFLIRVAFLFRVEVEYGVGLGERMGKNDIFSLV